MIVLICTFSFTAVRSAEPPSSLKLTVPDFTVTKIGTADYVEIPNGEILLLEQGRPRVPYYTQSIEYPKDYIVQDVKLKEKSGMKKPTGMNLPVVILDRELKSPVTVKEGRYPEKDFDWKVWDNPDSSHTLVISVYPFTYDPKTTEVTFYTTYQFEIPYIKSAVFITGLTTDKNAYNPTEKVKIELELQSTNRIDQTTIIVAFYREGLDKVIATLPPKLEKSLNGKKTVTFEWQPVSVPTGNYQAVVVLKDNAGHTLDTRPVEFRLGIPKGEVTQFNVSPAHFKIGDNLVLVLDFKNTGSCPLSGNCTFILQDSAKIIKQSSYPLTDLKPAQSFHFKDTWNTSGAKKGTLYYIVGYVTYEGGTTRAEHKLVSTNYLPEAKFSCEPPKSKIGEKIKFDASGSTDTDGSIIEYTWDFGDGATATGKSVTHSYQQKGNYEITLTVTDNEGGTASAKQILSVNE